MSSSSCWQNHLTRLAVPFIPVLGEDASAVSQSNVGCCKSEAINLKAA